MNKKFIVPTTLALAGIMVLAGCGETTTEESATTEEIATETPVVEDNTPICDENGNVYASEAEAKAAGLNEAQYGATYCQYIDDEMLEGTIEAEEMLNATYTIEGEEVTLVNGRAEVEAAPGSASKNVYMMQAGETEDGDLNGDGKEDDGAGVVVMSGAGSGTFYYAVAYVDGKGTNGVLIGDRINVDDVSIENGVIEIEYLDRAETAAMADAPTVEKKMMFIVTNGVLAEQK
jgi:hypothetical protein